ncbi:MAG: hypothetical protein OXH84_04620 [Gammaproteobacteria bacterium]|nr:hypothetical protein [Gammaproteobacteria bacterium]
MSNFQNSFIASLTALCEDQIRQAGQRYTPGIDPDSPNLKIDSLLTAVENIACGKSARERFQYMFDDLTEAWKRAKHCSQRSNLIQKQLDEAHAFLSPMMDRLRARDAHVGEEWSNLLTSIEDNLMEDWNHLSSKETNLPTSYSNTRDSSNDNTIRAKMHDINGCLDTLRKEKEFVTSAAFKVLFDPMLLISGEWGTGKTHLMCDFTRIRIDRNQVTVLVLAKNFKGCVLSEVCSRVEDEQTTTEVFDRLEEMARMMSERAIVILDGVNEGHRNEWRKAITTIQKLISERPNIGLIVTCRTPFESCAFTENDLDKFHKITHRGFEDQEFDAQAAFFEYYKLPLSEVPLLNSEFSRPLTLKLICLSLRDLSCKKLKHGFAGLASGQKGMTYVLEKFVNNVGKPIEREFSLRTKGCWELLKGNKHVKDERTAGFAPCMAKTGRDYVSRSEADRIVAANYSNWRLAQRRELLESLRVNGLIDEDVIGYSGKNGWKYRSVHRLPYQRFSDHLVARHLLNTQLVVTSEATIKQSFKGNSQLAKIFRISNRDYQEYAKPELAQALITEFPVRVKKKLPPEKCELFFMLPNRAKNLNAYFNPFVEGLFWREPEAFTQGTDIVVNQYLHPQSGAWGQMVDALVAVSTKPNHPYHARRLYEFLARFSMVDRDLTWSEYLRQKYASPTIHRLLTWAEKLNVASMTEQVAIELVALFSLVLTTVVRKDRDLATKALVLIGERYPEILFSHVETSLSFNDPYVSERMLAAAYGTTMSLVNLEQATTFHSQLGDLANVLYQKMFAPGATNATHHTLTRDYALGIIEIALSVNCVALPAAASQNLLVPFPNIKTTFESDGTPDPTIKDSISRVIQRDFEDYTIESLIPMQAKYDEHPDYVTVLAKIERRIFDLGYRTERFSEADKDIERTSWNASDHEKVDRYGKKYSWIAYFEMWGELQAAKILPDIHNGERTSDCGIDPSFPKRPPDWTPPIPNLLEGVSVDTEEWVTGDFTPDWQPLLMVSDINGHEGRWVLVEGYVRRTDESLDRELSASLRGLFIARREADSLKSKFLEVDYPGITKIPKGATEYYLYAGEAGNRQNYAHQLRQKNGRYRRQIKKAFDGYPPEISVEIPYIHFGWEPHHSPYNDFSGFNLPAPSLIQRLNLVKKNREIDFYESDGKPATVYREAGDNLIGDHHSLLYVRADLLRRYLTDTRQVLVWCNWGQRDWLKKMEDYELIDKSKRQSIYQACDHIHKSFFEWYAKEGKIVF